MNDYKELIEILRDETFCDKLDYVEDAADAIEQIVKERDGMAYLLKRYIPYSNDACSFCIHKNAKHDTKEFIDNCDVCAEAQHYCCWEYGRLPDSVMASMELNEIVKKKLSKWREEFRNERL